MSLIKSIHVVPHVKAVHTGKPTLFIYDSYPDGIGLSEKIFERWDVLLKQAGDHVSICHAESGCPVCIGSQEAGMDMKNGVALLLSSLAGGVCNVL